MEENVVINNGLVERFCWMKVNMMFIFVDFDRSIQAETRLSIALTTGK